MLLSPGRNIIVDVNVVCVEFGILRILYMAAYRGVLIWLNIINVDMRDMIIFYNSLYVWFVMHNTYAEPSVVNRGSQKIAVC